MEQTPQTFSALYEALPPLEKTRITEQIIQRCNASLWTIQAWSKGRRRPKARSKAILAEIFESTPERLFPQEQTV